MKTVNFALLMFFHSCLAMAQIQWYHPHVEFSYFSQFDSCAVVTIVEVHPEDAWTKYHSDVNWVGTKVCMFVGCTGLLLDADRKLWFSFAINPAPGGHPRREIHIMARIQEEASVYQAMRTIYKIPDIYSY